MFLYQRWFCLRHSCLDQVKVKPQGAVISYSDLDTELMASLLERELWVFLCCGESRLHLVQQGGRLDLWLQPWSALGPWKLSRGVGV